MDRDLLAGYRAQLFATGIPYSAESSGTTSIGRYQRTYHHPPSRARWIRRRAIMLAVAAAGWTWYALSPGVASYNIGALVAFPALLWLSFYLDVLLPRVLAWIVAVGLALGGMLGWLLIGGDRWWYVGQASFWPLIILIFFGYWNPTSITRNPTKRPEPWLGGPIEGPWGPP